MLHIKRIVVFNEPYIRPGINETNNLYMYGIPITIFTTQFHPHTILATQFKFKFSKYKCKCVRYVLETSIYCDYVGAWQEFGLIAVKTASVRSRWFLMFLFFSFGCGRLFSFLLLFSSRLRSSSPVADSSFGLACILHVISDFGRMVNAGADFNNTSRSRRHRQRHFRHRRC